MSANTDNAAAHSKEQGHRSGRRAVEFRTADAQY